MGAVLGTNSRKKYKPQSTKGGLKQKKKQTKISKDGLTSSKTSINAVLQTPTTALQQEIEADTISREVELPGSVHGGSPNANTQTLPNAKYECERENNGYVEHRNVAKDREGVTDRTDCYSLERGVPESNMRSELEEQYCNPGTIPNVNGETSKDTINTDEIEKLFPEDQPSDEHVSCNDGVYVGLGEEDDVASGIEIPHDVMNMVSDSMCGVDITKDCEENSFKEETKTVYHKEQPMNKTDQCRASHFLVNSQNSVPLDDSDSEDNFEPVEMMTAIARNSPETYNDHLPGDSGESLQPDSSVRMRYKVRSNSVDGNVPPLPPRRDQHPNETDNAPGVSTRRNENALSMVLPLKPSNKSSKRLTGSKRFSTNEVCKSKHSPNGQSLNADKSASSTINILPLPPKAKTRPLANSVEATSRRRYGRNAAIRDPRHIFQKSGSFRGERTEHHLPKRAQTVHTSKVDNETQFVCLLDLPLKHKGSIVSSETLVEKNVHDLLMAAKKGETDFVRTLLTKVNIDINVCDKEGMTALHYACRSGNQETVSLLIDRGACINSKTLYSSEPLMIALREKPEIETARKWHQRDVAQVVHQLVCAGASVHQTDAEGLSTLLVAISVENNYTTDYLLDNGADVNVPLQFRSVLHVISIQVSRGIAWLEIERKMLENGANPNVVDCCGNTPASLLFYSEFTPFDASDITDSKGKEPTEEQYLEYERYMDLPSVVRLCKPNMNTFGYTRKRLNRLLGHLQAGLDMNKMPMSMMLQLDKFLLREQNADVLRLFHSCGHYPSVGILQAFVPNQVENFTELWELLEEPATLMLTAASVVRVNNRNSGQSNATLLPLPKSIIKYVNLEIFEDIFKSFQV